MDYREVSEYDKDILFCNDVRDIHYKICNTWNKYFEWHIQNAKETIKRIDGTTMTSRGSGKTETLMNLSEKYNLPIIVPDLGLKVFYRGAYANNRENIFTFSDIINNRLRGLMKKMILLDEVETHVLREIKKTYLNDCIFIGFVA